MLRAPSRSLLAHLIANVLIVALAAASRPVNATASIPEGETSRLTKTAFGELIAHTGTDPQPYAFAGEPYDPNSGFQYHRARWMDVRVSRFVGMDSWSGSITDPPSLHRYSYARSSPANRTDPTGLYDADLGYAVELALQGPYRDSHPAHNVLFGRVAGLGLVPEIKPDILNLMKGTYLEIKPLSLRGISHGVVQMALYSYGLKAPWASAGKTNGSLRAHLKSAARFSCS